MVASVNATGWQKSEVKSGVSPDGVGLVDGSLVGSVDGSLAGSVVVGTLTQEHSAVASQEFYSSIISHGLAPVVVTPAAVVVNLSAVVVTTSAVAVEKSSAAGLV
jgi:hypothetical protein